jgi:hypothetical protein
MTVNLRRATLTKDACAPTGRNQPCTCMCRPQHCVIQQHCSLEKTHAVTAAQSPNHQSSTSRVVVCRQHGILVTAASRTPTPDVARAWLEKTGAVTRGWISQKADYRPAHSQEWQACTFACAACALALPAVRHACGGLTTPAVHGSVLWTLGQCSKAGAACCCHRKVCMTRS